MLDGALLVAHAGAAEEIPAEHWQEIAKALDVGCGMLSTLARCGPSLRRLAAAIEADQAYLYVCRERALEKAMPAELAAEWREPAESDSPTVRMEWRSAATGERVEPPAWWTQGQPTESTS